MMFGTSPRDQTTSRATCSRGVPLTRVGLARFSSFYPSSCSRFGRPRARRGRGLQTRSDSRMSASLWFHGGGHCWCAPPPCQMEERIIQPLSLLARKLSERLVWCWVFLVWRIEGEFSPHSEYSVLPVSSHHGTWYTNSNPMTEPPRDRSEPNHHPTDLNRVLARFGAI